MPELPDVELYLAALRPRILGKTLERVRLGTPFLLRSVEPPLDAVFGRKVIALRRLGKRIVWQFDDATSGDELFLVFHLMIAGRFRWRDRGVAIPKKLGLAAFDFADGTLLMTEAASHKRASLHVVHGEEELARHDPGGIDVMSASADQFADALRKESHTLKRALTDPHLFSGIGNAYSDEILHRAKLSPFKLTRQLSDNKRPSCVRHTRTWRTGPRGFRRKREESFPKKSPRFTRGWPCTAGREAVPALRDAGAADCARRARRNYCPTCQTEGDCSPTAPFRSSLKDDWPKSLDAARTAARRNFLASSAEEAAQSPWSVFA